MTPLSALVMQSGGCTPVLNQSLFGVVSEAGSQTAIGRIIGARNGITGLLNDDLVDLGTQSDETWQLVRHLPAAALGTTRHSPSDDELSTVMQVLADQNVGFCFIIGGNDSADTGLRICRAAADRSMDLNVVNVPKTIDNDLPEMDHSPGYGSAARFVALATLGAGLDAESMADAAPITIIEVMGRDAGWLAASAALAKRDDQDPPHVIGLPEVEIDEDRFVGLIEDAYRKHGFAVAVMAENTRGPDGVLGAGAEPYFVDAFGHAYHDSPARHVARLVSKSLGVRVRDEKPGTIQRSFIPAVSSVDASEAELAGRTAVKAAVAGHTSEIVVLLRASDDPYEVTTGTAPLDRVAGRVRTMPDDYIDRRNYFVTDAFVRYALPLVGSDLPRAVRLG